MSRRRKRDTCIRLYLYGFNWLKFAFKHDIIPFEAPCQDCGKTLITTLPFIQKVENRTCYGLAINCDCGSRVPYCIVGLMD